MVLEGIDDDMDELAVGGAVPARPEACVAVEAPTPDGRRVGAAAAAAGNLRLRRRSGGALEGAGDQVREHLLVLGTERGGEHEDGGGEEPQRRRRRVDVAGDGGWVDLAALAGLGAQRLHGELGF